MQYSLQRYSRFEQTLSTPLGLCHIVTGSYWNCISRNKQAEQSPNIYTYNRSVSQNVNALIYIGASNTSKMLTTLQNNMCIGCSWCTGDLKQLKNKNWEIKDE